jgi:NAD(P)-dependent dehydrogenase (short-subunit alcohol dehydrogenase family)
VADIPPQARRRAVVTRAHSGIGWHPALQLARAGGEVILTARTETKGRDAVARMHQDLPKASARFDLMDLASLKSVRAFARKVGGEAKVACW